VVGAPVGELVGALVVGAPVGELVGALVVGAPVGELVGALVVGAPVGELVGALVVGAPVGELVGALVVGAPVGELVGAFVVEKHSFSAGAHESYSWLRAVSAVLSCEYETPSGKSPPDMAKFEIAIISDTVIPANEEQTQ